MTQPGGGNVAVTTTTYGSTATFSCNTGYDLNGTATVTCQADGTWETLPSCDIKGTADFMQIGLLIILCFKYKKWSWLL